MKKIVALVRKSENSDFGVEFPDVPGCFSISEKLEDVPQHCKEILDLHLEGEEVPQFRSLEETKSSAIELGEDFHSFVEIEYS